MSVLCQEDAKLLQLVAEKSGFKHQPHFSIAFKFGISPVKYWVR
jgi:hypothetical protein